jgi:cytosine/adenosine deaminase-related metal-dependent hydrolase
LSPHAPYTASAALYRRAAAEARRRGWLLTTHVAESREEDEMLRHGTGPMAEFFGRAAEGVGAVEWLSRWDVLGTNCLAVHANHVTASEVELLAKSGTHVVHCPKSHRFFGREPVMWERWMKCGVNVCLGTDSLASNDSLDMFGEMRAVSGLSPRQVLALATVNAAKALNRDGKLGRIAPGAWADLIAVPVASGTADAHEAVVFAEKPVNFVMIGGKVVVS